MIKTALNTNTVEREFSLALEQLAVEIAKHIKKPHRPLAPSFGRCTTGQGDQSRLLGTIPLAVLSARRLLAQQPRIQSPLHELLAHPVHRVDAPQSSASAIRPSSQRDPLVPTSALSKIRA